MYSTNLLTNLKNNHANAGHIFFKNVRAERRVLARRRAEEGLGSLGSRVAKQGPTVSSRSHASTQRTADAA